MKAFRLDMNQYVSNKTLDCKKAVLQVFFGKSIMAYCENLNCIFDLNKF